MATLILFLTIIAVVAIVLNGFAWWVTFAKARRYPWLRMDVALNWLDLAAALGVCFLIARVLA